MLEKTGVPTQSQIESVFPSDERLSQGPVAVIECFQLIPCDPCASACTRGAILPFNDINDRPVIDNGKCNGCMQCITKCPGLAIMVVDMTYTSSRALIKIPYEFRPLPEVGQTVQALNREGKLVADAEVVQVLYTKNMNKVPVVSIAVDKHLVKTVRNIVVRSGDDLPREATGFQTKKLYSTASLSQLNTASNVFAKQMCENPEPHSNQAPDSSGIVCRCNDLSLSEIKALISKGYTTIAELKNMARIGMGPCQGRNCLPIVINELSHALDIPVAKLPASSFRPMVKSIDLGELAAYSDDEVHHG